MVMACTSRTVVFTREIDLGRRAVDARVFMLQAAQRRGRCHYGRLVERA
jgi:hypothetical protein